MNLAALVCLEEDITSGSCRSHIHDNVRKAAVRNLLHITGDILPAVTIVTEIGISFDPYEASLAFDRLHRWFRIYRRFRIHRLLRIYWLFRLLRSFLLIPAVLIEFRFNVKFVVIASADHKQDQHQRYEFFHIGLYFG